MRSGARRFLLAGLLAPATMAAQAREPEYSIHPLGPNACLDRATATRRVPVALTARLVGARAQVMEAQAGALLQLLGEEVQRALGARDDSLPAGEPALSWRHLEGALLVTTTREGGVSVAPIPTGPPSLYGTDSAMRVVRRALDPLVRSGEARLLWPEGFGEAAVTAQLQLERPFVMGDSNVTPVYRRLAVPVFSVAVPVEQPPLARSRRTRWPWRPVALVGRLVMEYVIDDTGGVEPPSIVEVEEPDRIAIPTERRTAHAAYVEKLEQVLLQSQWKPARVGGCAVRAVVRFADALVLPASIAPPPGSPPPEPTSP